ncbi:4-hydroxy-tetrahydrodipicolinate synthase [Hanamia caeni]|jgi:4-hydroxy-tetrahydrodipicolinate synthase|uniref:4-hydroxy-tetrahydrodipicolinate synthase n=1 Tax=Hanamia caeni TaxID=2294116 RepID=A0A3M9NGI7_9BACT|nr:4-hydroxy-tetrahydrodipicolinate synthase [Hanamia caeni]RNI36902.1 4-hydroxy-tetrahydrodipicolinate synthase [Hanamia caeni]
MSLINILTGTGVAIVTPFKKNAEVDLDSLGKLIDFIIDNGVEYIVSLGTTGETPTLSKKEQAEIVDFTSEKINGRVPLVLGIGGNNTSAIIDHFADFKLENITAILSSSPNYNKPSQEGIFQHYKAISQQSPLPVILYNVPGRTGSNITAETTLRLANECENVQGIKEASGNMVQCMHILKNKPGDFLFVSGDDHISLPLVACGSKGVISVVANAFPKDFSEMIRLALKNDFENAQKLHYKLLPAYDLLFIENNPAGVKSFLSELKLLENVLRLPLVPLSEPNLKKVKDFLSAVSDVN